MPPITSECQLSHWRAHSQHTYYLPVSAQPFPAYLLPPLYYGRHVNASDLVAGHLQPLLGRRRNDRDLKQGIRILSGKLKI